ncbi:MAG TPA: S24/S26 family peptidase [Coriobacteriia bacterium]
MRARSVAVRVLSLALAATATAWAAHAYRAVYVGGGSMSPALMQGDLAVVRRGSAGVAEGDVVLVSKPGWPTGVLHRVVAVGLDDSLTLRGDSNLTADRDPISKDAVLGVVEGVVPTGRVLAAVEGLRRW